MFLHQSAYLDHNLHCAGYPGHMHPMYKTEHREENNVNTYIGLANWQFGNIELRHCFWVAWVALQVEVVFRAEVASALESAVCVGLVEMHLFLGISSVSADSLRCHFGKEGICPSGFDEAWPGVFLSQPSPCYAPETPRPTSSLLRLQLEVSWSDIAFHPLQYTTTRLWPFWPYSMRGACRTVPAVADLLALP